MSPAAATIIFSHMSGWMTRAVSIQASLDGERTR